MYKIVAYTLDTLRSCNWVDIVDYSTQLWGSSLYDTTEKRKLLMA